MQKLKAQIFTIDYYSFKSKGYNMQMHHWKRFWNVYVGILGFINDAQILRMSTFYHKTTKQFYFFIDLDKKVSNLILWGTRAIPCCHGWWCHINNWRYITLCLMFCIIDNYFMAKVWLKILLDRITKDFRQELLQQTNLNYFFCQMLCLLLHVTWLNPQL